MWSIIILQVSLNFLDFFFLIILELFRMLRFNIFYVTNRPHPLDCLDHHLIFASNEGIYSLNLDDLQNIEMFQVSASFG